MINKDIYRRFILLFALSLVFWSCGKDDNTVTDEGLTQEDVIKIIEQQIQDNRSYSKEIKTPYNFRFIRNVASVRFKVDFKTEYVAFSEDRLFVDILDKQLTLRSDRDAWQSLPKAYILEKNGVRYILDVNYRVNFIAFTEEFEIEVTMTHNGPDSLVVGDDITRGNYFRVMIVSSESPQ